MSPVIHRGEAIACPVPAHDGPGGAKAAAGPPDPGAASLFVLRASISLAWRFEGERTRPVIQLPDRVADQDAVAPRPIEALDRLPGAERRGCMTVIDRDRPAAVPSAGAWGGGNEPP